MLMNAHQVTRLAKVALDLENLKSAIDAFLASEHSFYEVMDHYRQKIMEAKNATEAKEKKYPNKVNELKSALDPLVDLVQKGSQQVFDEKNALEQLKSAIAETMNQCKDTNWIKEIITISVQSKIVKEPLLNLQKLQQMVEENLKRRAMKIAKFQKSVKEIFTKYMEDWSEIEKLITQFDAGKISSEIQKNVDFLINARKTIEESMNKVIENFKLLNASVGEIFAIKNKCKSAFSSSISDIRGIKSLICELIKDQEEEFKKTKDAFGDWLEKHRELNEALGGVESTANLEDFLTSVEFEMDEMIQSDQTDLQAFRDKIDEVTKLHLDKSEHVFKRVMVIIEEAELSFNAQIKTYGENIQNINMLSRGTIEKLSETAKTCNEFSDHSSNLIGKLKSCLSVGGIALEELSSALDKAIQSKKKFEEAIATEAGLDELRPIFEELAQIKGKFQKALGSNEGSVNEAGIVLKQLIEAMKSLDENLQNLRSTFGESIEQFNPLIKNQSMILSGLTSLFVNIKNVSEEIKGIPEALEVGINEIKGVTDEGFEARERCLESLRAPVANYMRTHGLMIQPIRSTIDTLIQSGALPTRHRKVLKPKPELPLPKPVLEEELEPIILVPPPQEEVKEEPVEEKIQLEEKEPSPEEVLPASLTLPSPEELKKELEELEKVEEAKPKEAKKIKKRGRKSVIKPEEAEPVKSPLEKIREEMSKYEMPEVTVKSGKSVLEKIRKEVMGNEQ